MKILSEEEAKDIIPLTSGRETKFGNMLRQLKVGQAVVLEKKDWKSKSNPYRVPNSIAKKNGWKFEQGRMPDGNGWFFKRVL